MQQPPAPAAANPYGSYVSHQPQPTYTEPSYQPAASYPDNAAPSLAPASYHGYSPREQAASATWYGPPAITSGSSPREDQPYYQQEAEPYYQQEAAPYYQQADGYLPADGLGGTGPASPAGPGGGSHTWNGSATSTYAGVDYRTISYDEPEYPDSNSALAEYQPSGRHAAPYEQRGYGPDDYQSYSGYGARGI